MTEEEEVDVDESYSPSTVLVMLGVSLHFDHEGSRDVLSVQVSNPEERTESLRIASNSLLPCSVDHLHIILKSSSLSSLYDDTIVSTFFDALKLGAEATVHILGSPDMPVQFDDCGEVRTSLLLSGLWLEQEGLTEGDEGGWTLTARKPGGEQEEDDDDDEEEQEKFEQEQEDNLKQEQEDNLKQEQEDNLKQEQEEEENLEHEQEEEEENLEQEEQEEKLEEKSS